MWITPPSLVEGLTHWHHALTLVTSAPADLWRTRRVFLLDMSSCGLPLRCWTPRPRGAWIDHDRSLEIPAELRDDLDPVRLSRNLLSSMPMGFNLFGSLRTDASLRRDRAPCSSVVSSHGRGRVAYSPRVIRLSALRGYVLEELLAALLKNSGYDLLVDESQDPVVLCNEGNGLRVRGRGADHQADVLGQLRLRLPFMHPIRLFVEAKYRDAATGLAEVRNALGVVNDVNEHYSTALAARATPRYVRYQYRYALFSASGFTDDAQRFAIAQQISLIDLRGPAFAWILESAARVAEELLRVAESARLESFPVGQTRQALRLALGTWSLGDDSDVPLRYSDAASRARKANRSSGARDSLPPDRLADVAAQAAELDGRLYLGFTDSPFLLVLQPDDSAETEAVLESSPESIAVDLRFAGETTDVGDWTLTSVDDGRAVTLRIALPSGFEELLLEPADRTDARQRTSPVRTVTVALGEDDSELVFQPNTDPRSHEASDSTPDYRRRVRLDPTLATQPDVGENSVEWTPAAAEELLFRLRNENWPHAEVIEFAARHGGVIGRDDVYEIAEYAQDRMLRGFTRPTTRIAKMLIREGFIPRGVAMPLVTQYASGVVASHWVVPPEFTWILS